MREKIFLMLTEAEGFLSGEEMSRRLGISRAAVWKHVKALREEGCQIEAVTRKGYRLIVSGLHRGEIAPYLRTKWLGRKQEYFAVTDSTITEGRAAGERGEPNGFVIFADQQRSGRGRLGRPWSSPAGQGIWFSVLLRPRLAPAVAPQLTLATAVGIANALTTLGFQPGIKWPNDIFLDGRKVCGILTEMDADMDKINHVIVGIGINVKNEEFPGELSDTATSLYLEARKHQKKCPSRNQVAAELLNALEDAYETLYQKGFLPIREQWLRSNITIGQRVQVKTVTEETRGVAKSMNEEGYLIIETAEGEEKTVIYGDVIFPDKYKNA